MKFELYYYQKKGVEDIIREVENNKNVCYVLPTRGGKSGVIMGLNELFGKQGKVVYNIAHRKILLKQLHKDFISWDIEHGMIASGYPRIPSNIRILSQGLAFKNSDKIDYPDFIIIDECHRVKASEYKKIIKRWSRSIIIGFTASPIRLDGKSLGDIFHVMIKGPGYLELIMMNRLSKTIVYPPKEEIDFSESDSKDGDFSESFMLKKVDKHVVGCAIKQYEKICPGVQTLVFCINRTESKRRALQFKERGWNFIHLDSQMNQAHIEKTIDHFNKGLDVENPIHGIVNVALFIEGLTVKKCKCIIMLRPTESLMYYLQMAGRGMMYDEGQPYLHLIDPVSNVRRFGMPDAERDWNLTTGIDQYKSIVKYCPDCQSPNNNKDKTCRLCGCLLIKEVKKRDMESYLSSKEGELTKIDNSLRYKANEELIKKSMTLKDFIKTSEEIGASEEFARFMFNQKLKKSISRCRSIEDFKKLAISIGYTESWAMIQCNMHLQEKEI